MCQFHLFTEGFFVRAFKVTAETVNAIMAMPTETTAALLNSGTFGVEVAPVEVVDEGADVELELAPCLIEGQNPARDDLHTLLGLEG